MKMFPTQAFGLYACLAVKTHLVTQNWPTNVIKCFIEWRTLYFLYFKDRYVKLHSHIPMWDFYGYPGILDDSKSIYIVANI